MNCIKGTLAACLLCLAATAASAQMAPSCPGKPVMAYSGVAANAPATATLPAAVGQMTYISGIIISYGGSTAGSVVTATVTGLSEGMQMFAVVAGAGPFIGTTMQFPFNPPQPAIGLNTPVVVSIPALGLGNAAASILLTGCRN